MAWRMRSVSTRAVRHLLSSEIRVKIVYVAIRVLQTDLSSRILVNSALTSSCASTPFSSLKCSLEKLPRIVIQFLLRHIFAKTSPCQKVRRIRRCIARRRKGNSKGDRNRGECDWSALQAKILQSTGSTWSLGSATVYFARHPHYSLVLATKLIEGHQIFSGPGFSLKGWIRVTGSAGSLSFIRFRKGVLIETFIQTDIDLLEYQKRRTNKRISKCQSSIVIKFCC